MHPTSSLRKLLRSIAATSFHGALYRVVRADVLYGFSRNGPYTPRPLFNLGPARGGSRFTPKGGAPSLYLAFDMNTAMHEYTQIAVPQPLVPLQPPGALVTFSANVHLDHVLDLTKKNIRRQVGTTLSELAEPWRYRKDRRKPPTQRLGAAAVNSARIQAIKYRSTKETGSCFVIFTDALVSPAFIEVNDPRGNLIGRLP
jgi:RES domain-containing protein